jgi:prolyl-tRNA synthetase
LLDNIQNSLYNKALEFRNKNTIKIDNYEEMKKINEKENMFFLAHWDGTSETEEKLKSDTKMTIRNIPFENNNEEGKCIISGNPSKKRVLISKAY